MTKTETYEEWAKTLFAKQPANMKLLVVVDKLLTGFDAPPCTYLLKTKWGSCNPTVRHIRLNTELAKKPPECLEYIVVHELAHLLVPTHNSRFIALMELHAEVEILPGRA